MEQNQTPKYATLFFDVRIKLEISMAEYGLLEMVYHLSHKTGYCYKTAGALGRDLGITKQGVNYMIVRLIKRGLMERLTNDAIRVTDKYYVAQNVMWGKKPRPTNNLSTDKKVGLPTTQLTDRQLSSPKNNKENKKEAPVADENGTGYKKYLDQRKQLGL